jgi:hypothetical protein
LIDFASVKLSWERQWLFFHFLMNQKPGNEQRRATCVYDRAHIVHEPHMRRGERQVGVHEFRVLLEVLEAGPDNEPAERMPDEADSAEGRLRAVIFDALGDLLGEPFAHLVDVAFGVVLVGLGAHVENLRMKNAHDILEQLHIKGIPLEPVHQHHQMYPSSK